MGYKKLGLDIKNENAGIILKFKEETEILMEETGEKTLPLPDGTENFLIDFDTLKMIILSNKKILPKYVFSEILTLKFLHLPHLPTIFIMIMKPEWK